MTEALLTTDLSGLPLVARGKVRDIYALGDELLFIATDRISAFDHVSVASIPADAVTASGSGLDPDISPADAYLQVDRVAAARHLPVAEVHALVATFVQGRTIGILGEPRVDVLTLNIALDKLSAKSGS